MYYYKRGKSVTGFSLPAVVMGMRQLVLASFFVILCFSELNQTRQCANVLMWTGGQKKHIPVCVAGNEIKLFHSVLCNKVSLLTSSHTSRLSLSRFIYHLCPYCDHLPHLCFTSPVRFNTKYLPTR